MKLSRWSVLLPLSAIACQEASPPTSPPAPPSAPTTVASAVPVPPPPAASSAPLVMASASSAPPASSTPPAPPPLKTEGWTTHESKALRLSFRYPKETFKLTERGDKIELMSKLSRRTLGGDTNGKHTFGIVIAQRKGPPEQVFLKEFPSFGPIAFPRGVSGGFVADDQTSRRARVAGLEGYRLSMGVEGYNSEVFFLKRGQDTLLLHADLVGDVMSPEIPDEEQSAIVEAVVGSLAVK